jgi:hypothetical protein
MVWETESPRLVATSCSLHIALQYGRQHQIVGICVRAGSDIVGEEANQEGKPVCFIMTHSHSTNSASHNPLS